VLTLASPCLAGVQRAGPPNRGAVRGPGGSHRSALCCGTPCAPPQPWSPHALPSHIQPPVSLLKSNPASLFAVQCQCGHGCHCCAARGLDPQLCVLISWQVAPWCCGAPQVVGGVDMMAPGHSVSPSAPHIVGTFAAPATQPGKQPGNTLVPFWVLHSALDQFPGQEAARCEYSSSAVWWCAGVATHPRPPTRRQPAQVGTPGCLVDHLSNTKGFSLRGTQVPGIPAAHP